VPSYFAFRPFDVWGFQKLVKYLHKTRRRFDAKGVGVFFTVWVYTKKKLLKAGGQAETRCACAKQARPPLNKHVFIPLKGRNVIVF
jgi:hypothetical protein